MKIVIIGWYGTETIGDRAILAGICNVLHKVIGSFEIYLGSLYPFFTERTLYEDHDLIKRLAPGCSHIETFDSRNFRELRKNLVKSDLLIMGGGPLMDLKELYMVEYAFSLSRKKNIKSIVLGCGIGPVFKQWSRKSIVRILSLSGLNIFRDQQSYNLYESWGIGRHDLTKCCVGIDSAAFCADDFKKNTIRKPSGQIAFNLRNFPKEYVDYNNDNKIDELLIDFMERLGEGVDSSKRILLVPMSYFHLGDDDRNYFDFLLSQVNNSSKYEIQWDPLTLEETMRTFQDAECSIGMRFHSVVLQSILCSNNYALDYSGFKTGKIWGFLSDVGRVGIDAEWEKSHYFALQNLSGSKINLTLDHDSFYDFNGGLISSSFDKICTHIRDYLHK